jgi:hypothetical protein
LGSTILIILSSRLFRPDAHRRVHGRWGCAAQPCAPEPRVSHATDACIRRAFFELADQPIEAPIAVTTDDSTRLFDRLKAEGVHLFYVKIPVVFGAIGKKP